MRTAPAKTIAVALLACALGLAATPGARAAETGGVSYAPGSGHATPAHSRALATWFGPGFYGQRTACGQLLTPEVVGVAHRTLPCGTLVALSYHHRGVTVPVIDRGPYAGNGAEWDLTTGAARALGMQDTARVHARVVGSVANTPTLGLPAVAAPAPAAPPLTAAGGASAG